MKLPECSGYEDSTPDGHDYDCFAIHEVDCEGCLANYRTCGGLWHPETGKKMSAMLAILLYGFPTYSIWNLKKKRKQGVIR